MIYIVTYGEYSGYGIVGATTDRTIAEELAAKFKDEAYDGCRIEEWPEAEILLKPAWSVYFDDHGNTTRCDRSIYVHEYQRLGKPKTIRWGGFKLVITVLADTCDEAIKIAAEIRAKWLAEQIGL